MMARELPAQQRDGLVEFPLWGVFRLVVNPVYLIGPMTARKIPPREGTSTTDQGLTGAAVLIMTVINDKSSLKDCVVTEYLLIPERVLCFRRFVG